MVGLGLFAPLPLAVMIPFMAGQSFAMGEAFGKGFQYGKRRISSMTNEKFNSMSAKDHFDETTADITAMIPTMSRAIDKFHTLQTDIILKMIDYIAKLPAEVLPDIINAPGLLVPQEHKIDYGEVGQKILNAMGIDTTGSGKGFHADASLAPTIIQTPDTSTQIKLQNEINALKQQISTSQNPNISKVVIEGNFETTYNNKGQIISRNVIDASLIPSSQIAKSTSAQTIVKDFSPALRRPPTSIVTEANKLLEERRGIQLYNAREARTNPAQVKIFQARLLTINARLRALAKVYTGMPR